MKARKTEEASSLAADILATMPTPRLEDVIEDVFVAIAGNPAWMQRYRDLEDDLKRAVANQWIGRYVRQLADMQIARRVTATRTDLIATYTKLRY